MLGLAGLFGLYKLSLDSALAKAENEYNAKQAKAENEYNAKQAKTEADYNAKLEAKLNETEARYAKNLERQVEDRLAQLKQAQELAIKSTGELLTAKGRYESAAEQTEASRKDVEKKAAALDARVKDLTTDAEKFAGIISDKLLKAPEVVIQKVAERTSKQVGEIEDKVKKVEANSSERLRKVEEAVEDFRASERTSLTGWWHPKGAPKELYLFVQIGNYVVRFAPDTGDGDVQVRKRDSSFNPSRGDAWGS